MRLFSRAPKPPPATDKMGMAKYLLNEARCPYCTDELKTVEQVPIIYDFPGRGRFQMQKAHARCERDGLDVFAISPRDSGKTFFVRRGEYDFFQSDGTKTNPDAFSQYMESIPQRNPLEVLYETLTQHDSPFRPVS